MRDTAVQISLILLIVALAGCFRPPEFPEEPRIAFERLHLTDTASLVLTFHVRDGDGDIGLGGQSGDFSDLTAPFHPYGGVVSGNFLVTYSDGLEGPYDLVPLAKFPVTVQLYKGRNENNVPVYEYRNIQILDQVGDRVPFSVDDERPPVFDCESYEIVSFYSVDQEVVEGVVVSETLIEEVDTIFVQRNPFHFNIYIDIQVKVGNDYVSFDLDDCDVGYTARFPVFNRANLGRPLDGSISYAFFSVLFQDPESSPLLTETMRLRFYIYDRTLTPDGELQKSNEVYTPDFKLLDLRQGDLVAD